MNHSPSPSPVPERRPLDGSEAELSEAELQAIRERASALSALVPAPLTTERLRGFGHLYAPEWLVARHTILALLSAPPAALQLSSATSNSLQASDWSSFVIQRTFSALLKLWPKIMFLEVHVAAAACLEEVLKTL